VSDEPKPPALIIAFELERKPRAINAEELSEADLVRLVDWLVSHDLGLQLREWLARYLEWRDVS
jgi:hypothetical protein